MHLRSSLFSFLQEIPAHKDRSYVYCDICSITGRSIYVALTKMNRSVSTCIIKIKHEPLEILIILQNIHCQQVKNLIKKL